MKYVACTHCLKQQTPAFVDICEGCDELLNMAATLILKQKPWSEETTMTEVKA